MNIIEISENELFQRINNNKINFLSLIEKPEILVVKGFYPKNFIKRIRDNAFQWGISTDPKWIPLYDNCKDYHRLHDNYPKAYVKQKLHGFYYHGWLPQNSLMFDRFKRIFWLKNILGGYESDKFLDNKPSNGVVSRINIHHYPIGGGYQSEHIDPYYRHGKIQTLVVASKFGSDFERGGLYLRLGNKKIFIDQFTDIGDMIIMSTRFPHGVEAVDHNIYSNDYLWESNSGRWIIMPIFLFSDYKRFKSVKPVQVLGI